jgi:hypothetical protein
LLNLVFLPRYGWLGAAWTSLASDGLLLLSLWFAVQYKLLTAVQPTARRKPADVESQRSVPDRDTVVEII